MDTSFKTGLREMSLGLLYLGAAACLLAVAPILLIRNHLSRKTSKTQSL